MEYKFIKWINLIENTFKQKKQELVDRIYAIYKSNPNLSDDEIAKIVEPTNYNRRITLNTRIPGILWTFRGIPELIKKAIAENPNLDNKAIESLAQQTNKNVLTWMINAVRTNARRDKLYPEPTGTTPGTLPAAKQPRIPEPEPESKIFTYSDFGGHNPFSYDEPTRAIGAFGHGTGGGKRIFRKPPNS